jgi:hypothetical protein
MTTTKNSIKKIVLGIFVAGLAVAFSAFTNHGLKINNQMDLETWYFDPPTFSIPNPNEATHYRLATQADIDNCGDAEEIVCTIEDVAEGSHPKLSYGDVTTNESVYKATKRAK